MPIDDVADWRGSRAGVLATAERTGLSLALAAVIADRVEPRWRRIVAAGRELGGMARREAALADAMAQIVALECEVVRITLAAGLAIVGAAARPVAAADPGADPGGDRPTAA